jgi:hypothetical protein
MTTKKSKVKSYVRKGKVVRSHDRNNKKVSLATGVGALTGLVGGLGATALLARKYPNIDRSTLTDIGTQASMYGALGGAIAGKAIGNRFFLSPEERKIQQQKQIELEKKIIPYQDKDLSGIQGGISTGRNLAMLGGAGSLLYSGAKLAKQIKKKYPNVKEMEIMAVTKRIDPAVLQRYGSKAFKGAGKVALAAGVVGAGLGYLGGRKSADKINKRLGRDDIKESNKERAIKIAKGVGAAAIGAGVVAGLGYGIGTLNAFNPIKQLELDKLRGTFDQLAQQNRIRTEAKLREAGRKLVDEYKYLSRNNKDIKLLGDGTNLNPDVNSYDIIREQIKRKGEVIGRGIARRSKQNTNALIKWENYLTNPNNSGKLNAAIFAPTGAVVGLGLYKTSYGKDKYRKRNKDK